MGAFKRVVLDAFDLGLLVLVFLFLYGLFYAFGDILSDVQMSYMFDLAFAVNPLAAMRDAFFSAIATLSNPLYLGATLIYSLLLLYLSLLVIGWISKRRISVPENPFVRAIRVLIPSIILGIIVFAPLALSFSLLIYFSQYLTLLTVFSVLFFLFLIIYTPIVAPSLASVVVDADSVKEALSNGVLVGRRRWGRIILYMIGVAVVSSLIFLLFGFIAIYLPWAADPLLFLYQAISFILPLAVITEVYVEDAHGG